MIEKKFIKKVGIYRLTMKEGSDNFRESVSLRLIETLEKNGLDLVVYEPFISDKLYQGIRVENNLMNFKKSVELIIANRMSDELDDVRHMVFTMDVKKGDK